MMGPVEDDVEIFEKCWLINLARLVSVLAVGGFLALVVWSAIGCP